MVPLLRWHALYSLIGVFSWVVDAKQSSEVATLAHLEVNLIRDLSCFFPFCNIWLDFLVNPLSDFFTKGDVGFVEVGRMVLQRSVMVSLK